MFGLSPAPQEFQQLIGPGWICFRSHFGLANESTFEIVYRIGFRTRTAIRQTQVDDRFIQR